MKVKVGICWRQNEMDGLGRCRKTDDGYILVYQTKTRRGVKNEGE